MDPFTLNIITEDEPFTISCDQTTTFGELKEMIADEVCTEVKRMTLFLEDRVLLANEHNGWLVHELKEFEFHVKLPSSGADNTRVLIRSETDAKVITGAVAWFKGNFNPPLLIKGSKHPNFLQLPKAVLNVIIDIEGTEKGKRIFYTKTYNLKEEKDGHYEMRKRTEEPSVYPDEPIEIYFISEDGGAEERIPGEHTFMDENKERTLEKFVEVWKHYGVMFAAARNIEFSSSFINIAFAAGAKGLGVFLTKMKELTQGQDEGANILPR